jgi:hypothetical protein
MSVEFISVMSGASWTLSNIYAPCTNEGRQRLLDLLHDMDMADDCDWLLVGDFNLIRRPSDRNKPRGNVQDMLRFNAAISNQRLEELKLMGNKFTWTNKQVSPLLEKTGLVFCFCLLDGQLSWVLCLNIIKGCVRSLSMSYLSLN